ncbi:hypothetical protein AWQ07_12595 [Vibrio parahaemolyticus]|nr:hypothetical protein UF37_03390 [Vibrio parahaemolyticus]KYY25786.1 hypothetical protein AWQ06_04400 [Vibrio parahaemolyticus]KYY38255.1 hypothetical protein AWQ07_12595 [Vibrio parahaemolyticus]KYZ10435.1 hypothetical protein AW039_14810 [Vibrio parahaemolyticus]KYZ24611.1 hypothetical protein AW036_20490 [Vibrio parahaemolyticus]
MSLKPLGTRNAVENELTTSKDLLEKQCHKADFQQVNRFLKRPIKLGKERSSISANQDPEVQSAESSKAHERLDLNTLF